MDLTSLQDIRIHGERGTGDGRLVDFSVVAGEESRALRCLLTALGPGDELCLSDPRRDEGLVEVRRSQSGFELKRGQHGCAGSWKDVSSEEAFAALMEVAPWNQVPGEMAFLLIRVRRAGTG